MSNKKRSHLERVTKTATYNEEVYRLIPHIDEGDRERYDAISICRGDGSIRQVVYNDIHDREVTAKGDLMTLAIIMGRPVKCYGRNLQELFPYLAKREIPRLYIYDEENYGEEGAPYKDQPVITSIVEPEIPELKKEGKQQNA